MPSSHISTASSTGLTLESNSFGALNSVCSSFGAVAGVMEMGSPCNSGLSPVRQVASPSSSCGFGFWLCADDPLPTSLFLRKRSFPFRYRKKRIPNPMMASAMKAPMMAHTHGLGPLLVPLVVLDSSGGGVLVGRG